ncbi:hypothetical protein [Haloferula sp. BvORR071]|uniref:hypothetical protein n=1 Tax=Haloferula sp. BvORR071 TaxID=1396141 RepID=UPI002240F3F9|nr:hypothetical protein [Haloferula sp. BvORR071]
MKYRPSKRVTRAMLCMVPLGVALYCALTPEPGNGGSPLVRGEVVFRSERPPRVSKETVASQVTTPRHSSRSVWDWATEWLDGQFENLMTWERNPWKRSERLTFGSHYFKLKASKDPADQAKVKEIKRLGEELFKRVLARYPELAVADRKVSTERNGFLRWLEFSERFKADPKTGKAAFEVPEDIRKHLAGEKPWDAAAVRAWLEHERANLDEIRAIGLMPDQSVTGIDIERWSFIGAQLGKSATEILLLDARLAAEEGDAARALESIRAANGLADRFGKVETPSLLAITVEILIRLETQAYALKEVMPSIPTGQLDVQAWQEALNPTVAPPAEFARIMAGEFHVGSREFLMPMLADAEDPKYPVDPDALIDVQASYFSQYQDLFAGTSPADWTKTKFPGIPDMDHLSRSSRELIEILFVGANAWSNGFQRAQSTTAMTQAAFAIMQGQPIPNDPVYGLPYGWNPSTRTLTPPESPEFEKMKLKPIVVPRP